MPKAKSLIVANVVALLPVMVTLGTKLLAHQHLHVSGRWATILFFLLLSFLPVIPVVAVLDILALSDYLTKRVRQNHDAAAGQFLDDPDNPNEDIQA